MCHISTDLKAELLGSPIPALTSKYSNVVVCCLLTPSNPALLQCPNSIKLHPDSPAGPDSNNGEWNFWQLTIQRLLYYIWCGILCSCSESISGPVVVVGYYIICLKGSYLLCDLWIHIHQQNVKLFGSYNWTTQQLSTATLLLPDASRYSQICWVQCDVLWGAPRPHLWGSSMLKKLWNRIQEYPQECIVVFKMLQNQTTRMCKFRSHWEYWEYWPHLQDYSGALRTWRHTLREWFLYCLSQIVQFD